MPIRWRLTLWFSLILLITLIVFGAVIHTMLHRYLSNEVDSNLRIYSARVHGTLDPDAIPEPLDYDVIHSKLPPIDEFTSPGVFIQFVDIDTNVVVKSNNLGDQELPVSQELRTEGFNGAVSVRTVTGDDNTRVRIMASPMYLRDETLLLEVAQSLEPMHAVINRVRVSLGVGIALAMIMAIISGAILVRRSLLPIKHVTGTAQSIEASSDLSRRVGYDGPTDEIGQLALTFDHMIEHLDRVFQSQRHFVADASHELRSPITVIKGNLDLIKRNINAADRDEALRAIRAETDRMVKIVDDLLILAEVDSVQDPSQTERQQPVSLKKILRDEFDRAKRLAENRTIVIDRDEDLSIKGDVDRLSQLLGNLVDNAIRYTPKGGTITLSLFRDNSWACLEVSDTGIGIAPEHLPNIFSRFYRTDQARSRKRGGTGLGLAIVQGIAEQHGGTVTAASEPGKGSTFTAKLKL